MSQADIQLLIFYGGLPLFLGVGLLYALKVSRRGKAKSLPVTVTTIRVGTESLDALNRELTMEFTDRVHVASAYVQAALGEHPALTSDPKLMALYGEAVQKLEDLYQAVGRKP